MESDNKEELWEVDQIEEEAPSDRYAPELVLTYDECLERAGGFSRFNIYVY